MTGSVPVPASVVPSMFSLAALQRGIEVVKGCVALPTAAQAAKCVVAYPYAVAVAGVTAAAGVVSLALCYRRCTRHKVQDHPAAHRVATQVLESPAASPATALKKVVTALTNGHTKPVAESPQPSPAPSPAASPRAAAAAASVVKAIKTSGLDNVPGETPPASALSTPAGSPTHAAQAAQIAREVAAASERHHNGAAAGAIHTIPGGTPLASPLASPAASAPGTPLETPLDTPADSPAGSPKNGAAGASVAVVSSLQVRLTQAAQALTGRAVAVFKISHSKMLSDKLPQESRTMKAVAVVFKSGADFMTVEEAGKMKAQFPAMTHLVLKYHRPTAFAGLAELQAVLPGVRVSLENKKSKSTATAAAASKA